MDAISLGTSIAYVLDYNERHPDRPLFNGATRPYVTSYDNWRAAIKGSRFDPAVDRFMDRSVFRNACGFDPVQEVRATLPG